MLKSLVALALIGAMSAPAFAENPVANTAESAAKPQTVKKRVCQQIDSEDPYSRLGTRKVCKTVEVPVSSTGTQGEEPAAAANNQGK